jgi:HEAT repeat protein
VSDATLDRLARARDPRSSSDLFALALAEPDTDAAAEARHILRARGTREVLDAALELADREDWQARRLAAEILGELGWADRTFLDESVACLLELADDPHREVVIAALFGLGHRASSRGLTPLLARAAHDDVEMRYAVAWALPQVSEEPRAVAALLALSRDADADVRDWATFGLGTQLAELDTPEIRAALLERTRDDDAGARGEALMGLVRRRDPRALELIRAELAREDITVLTAEAAGELADPSLAPALRALYNRVADDPEVDAGFVAGVGRALEACDRRNTAP